MSQLPASESSSSHAPSPLLKLEEDGSVDDAFDACPECGSRKIQRSHRRNSLEKLAGKWFSRDPYRCESCGWRFFAARGSQPEAARLSVSGTGAASRNRVAQPTRAGSQRRIMLRIASVGSVLFLGAVAAFIYYTVQTSTPVQTVRPVRRGRVPINRQPGNLPFASSYDGHLATVPFLKARPPAQKPAETSAPSNVR